MWRRCCSCWRVLENVIHQLVRLQLVWNRRGQLRRRSWKIQLSKLRVQRSERIKRRVIIIIRTRISRTMISPKITAPDRRERRTRGAHPAGTHTQIEETGTRSCQRRSLTASHLLSQERIQELGGQPSLWMMSVQGRLWSRPWRLVIRMLIILTIVLLLLLLLLRQWWLLRNHALTPKPIFTRRVHSARFGGAIDGVFSTRVSARVRHYSTPLHRTLDFG